MNEHRDVIDIHSTHMKAVSCVFNKVAILTSHEAQPASCVRATGSLYQG